MMTVHEVSELKGVSPRTLRYYDQINLLPPTEYNEYGHRLYDDTALELLQQILLFRELQFPLKEIRKMLSNPDYDREQALERQIDSLESKRSNLENLIHLARQIKTMGVYSIDFKDFDSFKIGEYAEKDMQCMVSESMSLPVKDIDSVRKGTIFP